MASGDLEMEETQALPSRGPQPAGDTDMDQMVQVQCDKCQGGGRLWEE